MGDDQTHVASQRGSSNLAVLLLAGGLKSPPLETLSGRAVLALTPEPDRSLLDLWVDRAGTLSAHPSRLLIRSDSAPPPVSDHRMVEPVRDVGLYRGPAGAIRDVAESLPTEVETLLVCEALRVPTDEIESFVAEHRQSGAAVSVARNPDGSTGGVYAISRALISKLVPEVGFLDLKEQFLGKALKEGLDIRVFDLAEPGIRPARDLEEFITASCPLRDSLTDIDPDAPPGIGFSVVSREAKLSGSARVWRSIVMAGGAVSDGATVVRSLVLPGGLVKEGDVVVDAVIGR